MNDDQYDIWFLTEEFSTDTAEQVVETCLDTGFSLAGNENVEEVLPSEPLGDKGAVSIDLQYDDILIMGLSFNLGSGWDWNDPRLGISFSMMDVSTDVDLKPDAHVRSRVQERIHALLETVRELVVLTNPEYAWGMLRVGQNPHKGLRPTDRPISDNVDRFGWVTVLAEPIIADFGGRDHVLDAPAWSVEELETGHILIVRTDNPADPTYQPSHSLEEYLLEAEVEQEPGSDELEIADPFCSLSDGDFGADVVMDPALVGTDFDNEDLTLLRCRRDGDVLRDVRTGEAIRRIYDSDGKATGDVFPVDGEQFSPLLLAGIPSEFVRVQDPDDENIVTKVMGLDVDVDKVGLLTQLGKTVEPGASEEDLEAIENLLEQVADLEDMDGIERLIEQRLF